MNNENKKSLKVEEKAIPFDDDNVKSFIKDMIMNTQLIELSINIGLIILKNLNRSSDCNFSSNNLIEEIVNNYKFQKNKDIQDIINELHETLVVIDKINFNCKIQLNDTKEEDLIDINEIKQILDSQHLNEETVVPVDNDQNENKLFQHLCRKRHLIIDDCDDRVEPLNTPPIFHILKSSKKNLASLASINPVNNRPSDNIYDCDFEIFCSLCSIGSKDKEYDKKLGPLYGPFISTHSKFYLHELCAMYSPNIYLDKKNHLQNVISEIMRSKNIKCSSCGKTGASIFCNNAFCKRNFHYHCGNKFGCMFDNQTYIMHCPYHIENKIYGKDLNSDIVCVVCKSGLDEDILLICSKCDSSYHTYCHEPKILSIPEEDWLCFECEL